MMDFGLSQITGLFQLGDRLVEYWKKWRQRPLPETLSGRFVRLFEAHGVHRNQIPRFFGHGLQLKNVQDDAALIQCLTDEHLAGACEMFGVQRQWLERGEGHAHARRQFYIQALAFGRFIDGLQAIGKAVPGAKPTATLFGVWDRQSHVEGTLMVSEPIGRLDDEVIYRYHYVDIGPLRYWKARVSTAALMAQVLSRELWLRGRNCDGKQLGLILTKDLVGVQEHGLLMTGSRRVELEDWLLKPDALLEGMDPERNRFGSISALELWLQLEAQGLLNHPNGQPGVRDRFEATLALEKTV